MTCIFRQCTAEKRCVDCEEAEDAGRRAEHETMVWFGLDDARGALAEIQRRHLDAGNDAHARMALNALQAVIEAEATMRAADTYVASPSARTRAALRRACSLRVTPRRPGR